MLTDRWFDFLLASTQGLIPRDRAHSLLMDMTSALKGEWESGGY